MASYSMIRRPAALVSYSVPWLIALFELTSMNVKVSPRLAPDVSIPLTAANRSFATANC